MSDHIDEFEKLREGLEQLRGNGDLLDEKSLSWCFREFRALEDVLVREEKKWIEMHNAALLFYQKLKDTVKPSFSLLWLLVTSACVSRGELLLKRTS